MLEVPTIFFFARERYVDIILESRHSDIAYMSFILRRGKKVIFLSEWVIIRNYVQTIQTAQDFIRSY